MSQYDTDVALAARGGERSVNFGGVYENLVAQEFAFYDVPLYYYQHSRQGEIDFIGEVAGQVVPVVVKSGKSYKRHVALNNLLRSKELRIEGAYVLSEANLSVEAHEGGIASYIPLYMLPYVARELSMGTLKGTIAAPPTW